MTSRQRVAKNFLSLLVHTGFGTGKVRVYFATSESIEVDKPALDVSGMTSLYLDMGRASALVMHVPPQREPPATIQNKPDWSIAFREAGLDIANFSARDIQLVRCMPMICAEAWDGPDPLRPETTFTSKARHFAVRPCTSRLSIPGINQPPGTEADKRQSTLFHVLSNYGFICSARKCSHRAS